MGKTGCRLLRCNESIVMFDITGWRGLIAPVCVDGWVMHEHYRRAFFMRRIVSWLSANSAELPQLFIQNPSLPDETKRRYFSPTAIGNLDEALKLNSDR